ncbi:secretory phospholipase A2 receptor-like [Saccostrea cucullata]|uniref:secretory phospholipase A2 receptor-like n=1 Tax=Saccostrea cuccullata TaxID=36930 RepID=UPI002ED4320B
MKVMDYFFVFVLSLSCIAYVTHGEAPCPAAWIHFQTSCYVFATGYPEDWTEAGSFCNRMGAKLAEIETREENNFLRMHAIDNYQQAGVHFWIGGTDVLVDGQWIWITSQKRISYADWYPGEPNGALHESFVVTALGGTCNKPWVNHGDSCYLFVTHLQENWSEATSMCTELGGYLVEIESAQEDNFLKNYAIHQLQIQPGGQFGNGSFWIGGTDMLVEGNWFWLSTKQPFVYTDWYATSKEPNGGIRENCAHLGSHVHFHWNDADCHLLYNFICESE